MQQPSSSRSDWYFTKVLKHPKFIDATLSVFLVMAFAAVTVFNRSHRVNFLTPDLIDHLGAEYDSIAVAIRSGRGFSDPFREATGPTAWMPPVLPYLTAGLYWITGDQREWVVRAVVGMQFVVVAWTCWLILQFSRGVQRYMFGSLILLLSLGLNFHEFFQKTHDSWLSLLLVNVLWLGFANWPRVLSSVGSVGWGAVGGIVALASPVLGWTWACMTFLNCCLFRSRRDDQSGDQPKRSYSRWLRGLNWRFLVSAAVVSMLLVFPWAMRNRIVFERWIPIKSNAKYEVWQSLCHDVDGVLDKETLGAHPWISSGPQRVQYISQGEMAFLDSFTPVIAEKIRTDPWSVVERIVNRWGAACLWYEPFFTQVKVPQGVLFAKRIVYALPFVGLLLILLSNREQNRHELAAVGVYVLYLFPYILISYYERYGAPLLTVKCVLIVAGLSAWSRRSP